MNENLNSVNSALEFLKNQFVGKDEIIDLLGVALIARENAFLLGPPGTAKSAIVRALSECIKNGKNFEYLLTRFTEPNEIFGPFDIRKLKEGELTTNIEGMMPEASLVFLDEIFNANSAILNSLLMALNEKIFRRGKETFKLPTLMFIGASNLLPEDESLNALLDRFLIRVRCDYVNPSLLDQVLLAGRNLEKEQAVDRPTIIPSQVMALQKDCKSVELEAILTEYVSLVHALRNIGIKVSDRRAVKCQSLVAASALLSGRTEAILSDLWVMKHIWDTEEQIEIISGVVDNVIENTREENSHPQAFANNLPNAENLMKEITEMSAGFSGNTSMEDQNLLKDKLRFIQNQCKWIPEVEHKEHIQKEIDGLWEQMLKAV